MLLKYLLKSLNRNISIIILSISSLYFLRFAFLPSWWNGNMGSFDWDLQYAFLEVVLKSLMVYDQIPAWNPYYSGGLPILENLQVKFFSITTLTGILFGTVDSLKITFFIYYILGIIGMFSLLYFILRVSSLLATMGTILFSQSGWMIQHFYPGHCNFLSCYTIPWIFFFLSLAITKKKFRFILIASIIVSHLVIDGNFYFFLYSIFILSLVAILQCFNENKKERIFIIFSIVFISISLSMYRLLPAWDYVTDNGAFFKEDVYSLKFTDIWNIFTIRSQHPLLAKNWDNQEYNWWEYGNYIGELPFILLPISLWGLYNKDRKLFLGLIGFSTLTIFLMMGKFHEYSPMVILSKISGYSNLRCHARWSFYLVFFLSISLCLGLQYIYERYNNRIVRKLFIILIIISSIYLSYDLSSINSKILKDIFPIHKTNFLEKVENESQLFKENFNQITIDSSNDQLFTVFRYSNYHEFSTSSMYPSVISNISSFQGYDVLNRKQNISHLGRSDYLGEIYLSEMGSTDLLYRSPSKLRFLIDTDKENRLIFNMNYNKHWKINKIESLKKNENTNNIIRNISFENYQDKLSIKIPSGKYEIYISYWNHWATGGFFMGMLSLIVIFFFHRRFVKK